MSSIGGKVAPKFRESFKMAHKESVQWFPGHMRKGLNQMQQRLKNVDCVIEVHDARIPLSGRFTEYRSTVSGLKPHIFVLNKKDLADRKHEMKIRKQLRDDGLEHVVFTNLRDQTCKEVTQILPLAIELISNSNRYNRSTEQDFSMMVIGVPNVGKSSLINRLRNKYLKKGNASRVGGVAGITRAVLTHIKINEKPLVYLLDTPGILEPQVRHVETGMKLAAVGCLQDHLVGEEHIADFLLYWLNKHRRFEYVKELGLPEITDNILEVLTFIASKLGKTRRIKNYDGKLVIHPDYLSAAQHFIKVFRTGQMGPVCLDDDLLET